MKNTLKVWESSEYDNGDIYQVELVYDAAFKEKRINLYLKGSNSSNRIRLNEAKAIVNAFAYFKNEGLIEG